MKKAVIAIAAILVVGAAGFTGWRAWQLRSEKDANPPNQTQSKQNTTQTSSQPPSNPEGGKYLPIPEWGVKIKLSDTLKGAKYSYKDSRVIYVTTNEAQAIKGCQDANVLSIQRGKKGEFVGPSTVDDILANNPDVLTKLGDYYYAVIASPSSCVSPQDPAGVELLSKTKAEFEAAIKTISSN